ncbi:MAG TPA: LLM class flavin-dependent oxidoreductase, partial [Pseudolysinimonas sp.]|nr:LLM class flavin-dependent oxidoreductase [Pseudolysinimonas sp.]
MEHDGRYRRMEEFIDVCQRLWRSVAPDAFIWDNDSGMVADPSKIHSIDHVGEFFQVKGPLNSTPSPQHAPVLIQAGGSPRGISASSKFADIVFAGAFKNEHRAAHRESLDEALRLQGRDPESVGILWDLELIVGQTSEEARHRKQQLEVLLPPEAAAAQVSHNTGLDMKKLPAKFTLEELREEVIAKNASPMAFRDLIAEKGADYEMTKDELFETVWRAATGHDHTVAGSAEEVADYLEEAYESSGSRGGFMIAHPQVTPRDLIDVVGFLIPELRRRGRFRTEYEGTTLRDTLGLPAFA